MRHWTYARTSFWKSLSVPFRKSWLVMSRPGSTLLASLTAFCLGVGLGEGAVPGSDLKVYVTVSDLDTTVFREDSELTTDRSDPISGRQSMKSFILNPTQYCQATGSWRRTRHLFLRRPMKRLFHFKSDLIFSTTMG